MTKTAEAFADMVLPAASSFEKEGTFMNAERRIQRIRKAIDAPGAAWPDWRIVCELARRMGHGAQFGYSSSAEIWDEIRRVWPEVAGISYPRLEQGGIQWPCRTEQDVGTAILHTEAFAHSKRAPLQRVEYLPTAEKRSAEFPFLLTTGRDLYQFNAGTMTGRTANSKLRRTDTLDVAPADAARLGIATGDSVRVHSSYGTARIKARVTDRVTAGELFATFHDPRIGINRLTSPFRDSIVQSPEYKLTAVAIEKLAR
jgi:formate dehydrogenase major subunit